MFSYIEKEVLKSHSHYVGHVLSPFCKVSGNHSFTCMILSAQLHKDISRLPLFLAYNFIIVTFLTSNGIIQSIKGLGHTV